MKNWIAVLALAAAFALAVSAASAAEVVRVGALKFGTVNWELDTIAKNGFDKANGIEMTVS